MWNSDEYYEGKRAFGEGYDLDECQYPYGSNEHEDWMCGYEDAQGESSCYD